MDVDRFASHDGPGIRTAVFLKGCPLRCQWCHSPESQSFHPELLFQGERCTGCWLCLEQCPAQALKEGDHDGRHVVILDRARCTACGRCTQVCYSNALRLAGRLESAEELAKRMARDAAFFRRSGGGVTLTGGEPTSQFEFSLNFLMSCQSLGLHTALETTGFAPAELLVALAGATDLILYDIKHMDSALHRRYTGVANELILSNLRRLVAVGAEIQVRLPCIPGFNDSEESVRAIAQHVARIGLCSVALLPYNGATGAKYQWLGRPYALASLVPQSDAHMEILARVCRAQGLLAQVGG